MLTVLSDTGRVNIMARRSSKKSLSRPQGRRASPQPSIARLRLHPLPPTVSRPFVWPDKRPSARLRVVQDRRTWFPSLFRPAASLGRRADTKLIVPSTSVGSVSRLPDKVAFDVPRRVLICVRRKVRKEVIHALGKGGGGNRKPRRNEFSDVRC